MSVYVSPPVIKMGWVATLTIRTENDYFSITGSISKGGERLEGACHSELLAFFPWLKEYLPLHLCDMDGTPMHYFANSLYWAGFSEREYSDTPNLDYFINTCLYGFLEQDKKIPADRLISLPRKWVNWIQNYLRGERVRTWLKHRLPKLQDAVKAKMAECTDKAEKEFTKLQMISLTEATSP